MSVPSSIWQNTDCTSWMSVLHRLSSYSSNGFRRASASWSEEGTSDRCWKKGRPWMQVRLCSPSCSSILRSVSSTSSLDKFAGSWRASRTASPCRSDDTYLKVIVSDPENLDYTTTPSIKLKIRYEICFDFIKTNSVNCTNKDHARSQFVAFLTCR